MIKQLHILFRAMLLMCIVVLFSTQVVAPIVSAIKHYQCKETGYAGCEEEKEGKKEEEKKEEKEQKLLYTTCLSNLSVNTSKSFLYNFYTELLLRAPVIEKIAPPPKINA